MKTLLLVLFSLAVSACATANQPGNVSEDEVKVIGVGTTQLNATNDGFRKAIEYKLGTLLVTNIVSVDDKIIKDEIINYSSGYVKSHRILNTEFDGRQYKLTMLVEVASSKIANRILSTNKNTAHVKGQNLFDQARSHYETKNNAAKLLETVLADYPYKAYNTVIYNQKFVNVNQHHVTLAAYYKLTWNKNWLAGLNEVLSQIGDGSVKTKETLLAIVLENKQNQIFTFDNLLVHYFNDNYLTRELRKRLHEHRPYVKLKYYSGSKVIDTICDRLSLDGTFYKYEDVYHNLPSMRFNTFTTSNEYIGIIMQKTDPKLKDITMVDIEIVTKKECE